MTQRWPCLSPSVSSIVIFIARPSDLLATRFSVYVYSDVLPPFCSVPISFIYISIPIAKRAKKKCEFWIATCRTWKWQRKKQLTKNTMTTSSSVLVVVPKEIKCFTKNRFDIEFEFFKCNMPQMKNDIKDNIKNKAIGLVLRNLRSFCFSALQLFIQSIVTICSIRKEDEQHPARQICRHGIWNFSNINWIQCSRRRCTRNFTHSERATQRETIMSMICTFNPSKKSVHTSSVCCVLSSLSIVLGRIIIIITFNLRTTKSSNVFH